MNSTAKTKISVPKLIVACAISLAAGALGALLAGTESFKIYGFLKKPPFAPPMFIFPIVWTLLFLLMGTASYIIYESGKTAAGGSIEKAREYSKKALTTYAFYLVLNILWPTVFFKKGAFLAALLLVAGQFLLLCACVTSYSAINKKASLLMLPSVLWTFYAMYLNAGFLFLNS